MTATALGLVTVVLAYLMGSIPTGLLVARWRGVDIRTAGSGNIGATNVLRAVGPFAALLVVLIDPLKGVVAVSVPTLLGIGPWWVAAAALAAVLGNCFNVFLRFRGGKGVATSLGVFVTIDPWVSLTALAVFALTLAFGRMVSLASVVAVAATPLMLLMLGDSTAPKVALAFALALVIVWRHQDNLARLAAGTERRLGAGRRG
ncbi:MAG: glycerol-3-phosphate 1-O-acyltransferase PlsY [Trueperaceae bacterium]|nr:glycerol-3-phosphate 1-O-acyltransferase PlsY [Trueperaceae bacterium]